ncbi:molybdopterin-guanine dinucleotide biosynthesis protein MobB [Tatumella sp. UBA2305]|uniref:molybdopterin-guanine dinucleotide biosynthesis protein MobB n=1 Tax=Tatumella sp. UBA2305 TaxID=1947647 RepID=UPI0025E9B56C|nr:molybdopterin-guanine dinucleotide biosynthesis protein MobB [Tatumella sp. UBA2305]
MTVPVLGIVATSGTGKTTLLKQIIPLLKQYGIRPGLIKHTHHQMDIDIPGKDSYELRKAGADQVIVASQQRWALVHETPDSPPPDLQTLALRMTQDSLDIILVEGFKQEPIPKIMLWRSGYGEIPDFRSEQNLIAIASDHSFIPGDIPWLDINHPTMVAEFIRNWLEARE